jgi:hypothetical protein
MQALSSSQEILPTKANGARHRTVAAHRIHRIPFGKMNWPISSFLIGTHLDS